MARRRSADERRALVVEAARHEFAAYGLYGATGEAISYRAGISHPYLLRLFGSKRDLFLAVVDQAFDELLEALRQAAAGSEKPALGELEAALRGRFEGPDGPLLLQLCAACGDEQVRPVVRRRLSELHEQLLRLSGAEETDVRDALARVMLAAAAEALRLPEVASREHWARTLLAAD